jgi:hypothetical protein
MTSYAEALREFYSGEVLGEALYSALLGSARDDDQRLKMTTLLQLETETKAWLRTHMLAHGVSCEEQAADREKGSALAALFKPLPWSSQMQMLRDLVVNQVVPLYQSYADAAQMRGNADETAVCLYMVEHEKAQVQFAERELAGENMDRSLEPLAKYLKYPLRG